VAIDEATLPDAAAALARKAAKDAHRAMLLTMVCVAVAIAVLAIDNTIKRAILDEASQVREIFRQFREATDGLTAAIEKPASDSADDRATDGGAGDLAKPARTRAAANSDADPGKAAGPGRKSGTRARS
jgi:hypothetical protein